MIRFSPYTSVCAWPHLWWSYGIQAAGRELPREETGYSFCTDRQSKGRWADGWPARIIFICQSGLLVLWNYIDWLPVFRQKAVRCSRQNGGRELPTLTIVTKETQEGCLSFSIISFSLLEKCRKTCSSVSKKLFDTLHQKEPCIAWFLLVSNEQSGFGSGSWQKHGLSLPEYFFRLKELKSITLAQMLPKTGYKIATSASIPFYQDVCERDWKGWMVWERSMSEMSYPNNIFELIIHRFRISLVIWWFLGRNRLLNNKFQ